jgi:hypothetical protein
MFSLLSPAVFVFGPPQVSGTAQIGSAAITSWNKLQTSVATVFTVISVALLAFGAAALALTHFSTYSPRLLAMTGDALSMRWSNVEKGMKKQKNKKTKRTSGWPSAE